MRRDFKLFCVRFRIRKTGNSALYLFTNMRRYRSINRLEKTLCRLPGRFYSTKNRTRKKKKMLVIKHPFKIRYQRFRITGPNFLILTLFSFHHFVTKFLFFFFWKRKLDIVEFLLLVHRFITVSISILVVRWYICIRNMFYSETYYILFQLQEF